MKPEIENTPEVVAGDGSSPSPCSEFLVGSRWLTDDGMEITVTQYYELMPGCWRLCYDGPNGSGGHMGQNHINRLTPLDTPNRKVSDTAATGAIETK